MIDYIRGPIRAHTGGTLTVLATTFEDFHASDMGATDCFGVGYLVHVTPETVKHYVDSGENVAELWLHHRLVPDAGREYLYGFLTLADRAAFIGLTELPKVGPGVAMKVLSATTLANLKELVRTRNEKALKALPGIGPKLAQRLANGEARL